MSYYTIYRENIWEAWSLAGPVLHMTSDLQANIFIPNVIKSYKFASVTVFKQ